MPTLGDRLRMARKTKDLSQEQVAAIAGHEKAWCQRLENNKGNPTWADMVDIGKKLEVSLDHLAHGGAAIDPTTWVRFQHLSHDVQAQLAQLIDVLYDREALHRVAGGGDKEGGSALAESD